MRARVVRPASRAIVIAKATRQRTAESSSRSAMIQTPKQVTNSRRLPPRVPVTKGMTKRRKKSASRMPRSTPPGTAMAMRSAKAASAASWPWTEVAAAKISSAEASLSRLSPFSTATTRLGMLTPPRIAVAAAASGGATMAPSASAA